jgi:Ecdysteroid kinase-like family
MEKHLKNLILNATGANDLYEIEHIQDLWSGYGVIMRYGLKDCAIESVIVKHVQFPKDKKQSHRNNSDLSHKRKLRSYKVETAWYSNWSNLCDDTCHVPECLAFESHENEIFIVLEDLISSGYSKKKSSVSIDEIMTCLNWLANFHATFMEKIPEGLWKVGTYWHLDTRPDELKTLDDLPLKKGAGKIDKMLRNSPFQTFVHGDAKLANFCFSESADKVAAVDFQYVGGGCGMKDVAYFIGSCLPEHELDQWEKELLDQYFYTLSKAVKEKSPDIDVNKLVSDWRSLYHIAWTDFHRFIKGWCRENWKKTSYSERISRNVLEKL